MASSVLHRLIQVEQGSKLENSQDTLVNSKDIKLIARVVTKDQPWANIQGSTKAHLETQSPSTVELDELLIGAGAQYNGPDVSVPPAVYSQSGDDVVETNTATQGRVPTPNQLEVNRPSSTSSTTMVDVVPTIWNPRMNFWRVISASIMFFAQGMNDSVPGALLPYTEKYYHLGYALVSLIFIANAAGFILAAFFVHATDSKLGRAKTMMFTDAIQTAAYAALAVAPPFPVFVLGFFIIGWALTTVLALNNVFGANLANSTTILGCLHGSYGIGGVVAPVLATTMVNHGILFARFYFILLGLRVVTFFFAGWVFWQFERGFMSPESRLTTGDGGSDPAAHASAPEAAQTTSKVQELKQAVKNKTTLIGALFLFAYQGAEVSISGWIISFLINYRGSDPSKVGYVTAGSWGGITVGRFALSYAAHRLGEKAIMYGLVAGALGLQLMVWFLPNVIGDSVAIALIGLVLGPVYPCAATVFTRLLPRRLQNTALAFMSSAGSSGGAFAPFMTGLLAQVAGTWVLHPICITMFVLMEVCWFLLPKLQKRRD